MAFSELELKRYDKITKQFIEKRRPPIDIRDQVDLGFRIKDYTIEIFEIRPLWNNPNKKIEESIAKTKYINKTNTWKVYWQRADLKWHSYEPHPETDSLNNFLKIIDEDEYSCFWG